MMSAETSQAASDGKGTDDPEDPNRRCAVIANREGQYSLWPADRPVPAGWRSAGPDGTKAECLAYIARVWTDITPRSVRDREKR